MTPVTPVDSRRGNETGSAAGLFQPSLDGGGAGGMVAICGGLLSVTAAGPTGAVGVGSAIFSVVAGMAGRGGGTTTSFAVGRGPSGTSGGVATLSFFVSGGGA